MQKDNKDLPAKSAINQDEDDARFKQQEEFDNKGKDELGRASEVKQDRQSEHMRDSQEGRERMTPETKKKESEANYREDRKQPYLNK